MGKLTWIMIILNVIIFELVFSMPENLMKTTFEMFAFSSPCLPEIWRMFSSLFLHASASHLFFNMLGLYFFGNIVEEETSMKEFLLIFFLSGIGGNLVYGFTSQNPVVGASGCVFGLMGFAMFMKPKEIIRMYFFPLPLGVVAVIYAIVETLLAYFGEFASGVAHSAHVTGLVIGGLFAFRSDPRRAGKGMLWLLIFVALLILLGPVLGLVLWVGNLILGAFEAVVGFVVYGLAKILTPVLWG